MKVVYGLKNKDYKYELKDSNEILKSNFLLTNPKGDFLNLGIKKNSSKFQGYNFCNSKTLEVFKVLDELILNNLDIKEVRYSNNIITRQFTSNLIDSYLLIEDSFYLGPTGGFIYEIKNYDNDLLIDLDCRSQFDFDKIGRDYKIYNENGIIFIEYTKFKDNNEKYKLFLAIKTQNLSYELMEKWLEKEYEYSKLRNSESKLYVYRALKININSNNKTIYFGISNSKKEALLQIDLLENHNLELKKFDKELFQELTKEKEFLKPLTEDINIAYKLSNNSIYNFYNKNLEKDSLKSGSFAGFPWFSKIWARDEIVGLRTFINNNEFEIVKEKMFNYINSINDETGLIKRIDEENSLESIDSIFWLSKRFEDLVYELEEEENFLKIFNLGEIKIIFEKFSLVFNKIINNYWDNDLELLKVKDGDPWMDTISAEFPLDIQVQFLQFISVLSQLSIILQSEDSSKHYLDFENGFRQNIKLRYLRNSKLYNEVNFDDFRSNVFLIYYFYPDLFLKKEWEQIFDEALIELKTNWGGISSLSKKNSRFKNNYTGENNLSYHNGDSWFWINNITAIVLNDLNEKKYRNDIRKILISSTKDILKLGTIGYGSELSSSSSQKAEGCLAQLWSSSTYLEMIDKLFERKTSKIISNFKDEN